jgi:hypothetical protein
MVNELINDVDQYGAQTDEALEQRNRRDIVIRFDDVEAEFQNGTRLDRPGGDDSVPGGVNNEGKVGGVFNASKPIELIHFGTVYSDRSDRFAHDEIDDTLVLEPGVLTGRAAQYRDALQRELILLESTAKGLVAAIEDVYGPPGESGGGLGAVGDLLGFAGDLLGGPAASSQKMATADFETVTAELDAVWDEINAVDISYEKLHAAGIRLHEIRNGLRTYMKTHRDRLENSLSAPGGGGSGILAGLPFLGDLVPPALGEYFAYGAAVPHLIFDVYMQTILDLSLVMGASVDAAVRDKSIDAITSGFTPVFPVWYPPPPPEAGPGPAPASGTGIDAIDGAINDVNNAVQDVENQIDEVVDFLSRPYERSPGGPFVDRAFGGTELGLAADEVAGVVAVQALKTAVGYDPPELVITIFEKLAGIIGGFVRSVYSQLVIIGPRPVRPDEVVEAGRRHLIDATIECLFSSLPVLEFLRDDFMPPVSIQGWSIPINGRALIDRAKELLAEELSGPLQPVMDFAMGDLADTLNAALLGAKAPTMEAHLGIMPVCFGKLLRNIFFPIWDLLMKSVFAAITSALSSVMPGIDSAFDTVTGTLQSVRDVVAKVKEVNDILADGFQADLANNDVARIINVFGSDPPPGASDETTRVRDRGRKKEGKASKIQKAEYERVVPEHKWVDPDEAAAEGGAS